MSNLHKNSDENNKHTAKGFQSGVGGSFPIRNENGQQTFEVLVDLPNAIAFVDGNAAPPTTNNGDIYVLVDLGNGAVDSAWGTINSLDYNSWVRKNQSVWLPINPIDGQFCWDLNTSKQYRFNGSAWVEVAENATHTGEVTGATALTVDKVAITNKTTVTADAADYVLISDSSDSGNLKKALVSDFGGGGGKVAIYDSSGVPTFYATLSDAMAAAVSGNTIQLMTSMTEVLTTALTLNLGVDINLNGNTLTIDQNNTNITFQPVNNYVGKIINGTIKKINGTGEIFSSGTSTPEIDFTGLVTDFTGGYHAFFTGGTFYGIRAKGLNNVVFAGGGTYYDSIVTVTVGICFQSITAIRCSATATTSICYNQCTTYYCRGQHSGNSGNGVYSSGTHYYSWGTSINGSAFYGATAINCWGYSTNLWGCIGSADKSTLYSVNERSFTGGKCTNCDLRSDNFRTADADANGIFTHNYVVCNYSSAIGIGVSAFNNAVVTHNHFKLTHASAYGIDHAGGTGIYAGLNTVKGGASVYSAGTIKLTINTTNSQGDLKLD